MTGSVVDRGRQWPGLWSAMDPAMADHGFVHGRVHGLFN